MGLLEGMRNRVRSTSSGHDLAAAPSAAVPPLSLNAASPRSPPPACSSSQDGEPDSPRDEPQTPTAPGTMGRPRAESSPRGGIVLRAQKKVAGKMASSDTAKKLIRKFCPPEMFGVLDALGRISRRDPLAPPDFAKQQEETLLKLGFKVAVMYENGKYKVDDFVMSMRLLKRLSAQLIRKWEAIRDPKGTIVELRHDGSRREVVWVLLPDPHDKDHAKIVHAANQLLLELERLLSGEVRPGSCFKESSVDKLRLIFAHWSNAAAIARVLATDESHQDVNLIVESVRPPPPKPADTARYVPT